MVMGRSKTDEVKAGSLNSSPTSISDPDGVHFDASSDEGTAMELHNTTEARLMLRVDCHLMPCVVVLFFLAFLDKVNIANAAVLGMLKDLDIASGNKYNIAVALFFVPYTISEIPANILMKKFKPHVWLSGSMIAFGVVGMCGGLVRNYSGLLAVRFFLGLAECGTFPACFYLIAMWYKRAEAQRRFSFFFSSASLAGAFGGLLAAAIAKMDGVGGQAGWRWILILEGLLTIVVGVVFFFILTDFPEDAKWLNENERAFIKARLYADQGSSAADKKITLKDIAAVFKDIKIWIGGIMYFAQVVPAYGYAYFAPTIIKGYGYSPIQTQLHSVPPWACAFGFAIIIAYFSDHFKHRYIFALIPALVAITGLAILISVHDRLNVQYAALFLTVMGIYSSMPVMICWFQLNLAGHHRRAVAVAWQIGFGNIGGIPSVWLFPASDAKKGYRKGYSTALALMALSSLLMSVYFVICRMQNARKAKQPRVSSKAEKEALGDLDPDYKYIL